MDVAITDSMAPVLTLCPALDNRPHDFTDGLGTYLAAVPLLRRVLDILSYGIGTEAGTSVAHDAVASVFVTRVPHCGRTLGAFGKKRTAWANFGSTCVDEPFTPSWNGHVRVGQRSCVDQAFVTS